MKSTVIFAVAASVFGFGIGGTAQAADKPIYALVAKALGVPFYADAERGCKEEAAKIGAECLFTGPAQTDDAEQARVVRDLITRKVAGLSISVANPASMSEVISLAVSKNIPVVTFDADAPQSKRAGYIGTNNEVGGASAGESFVKSLPNGGTYAMITGGLAANNLNDRIKGFKSKLGGNFKEISGSPFASNDDTSVAVQLVQEILTKNPNIDGIFFVGGWAMFAPEAYKRALAGKVTALKSGKLVIVSFDTLPAQIKLLKEGYVTTLVGQRPLKMGIESIKQLDTLSKGGKVPALTDTGVDIVDASNVEKFAPSK